MTIETIAVFGAETREVTDITFLAFSSAISSAQAKTGTYSYARVLGSGVAGKALLTPLTAIRTGFWIYMSSSGIQDTTFLFWGGMSKVFATGSSQLHVRFNTGSGLLELRRVLDASNYEVLATCPIPSQFSTTGTWFPVGITWKIDATDGFFGIYVGGSQVMSYTGDTRPTYFSGTRHFDTTTQYVLVAGASGTSGAQGFNGAFIDDHYVDSYVGEDDAPVPSTRFLYTLPDGAGADHAFTPVGSGTNYQNVDENPNTGDTDYNKALAADLRDTFTFANITVPTDHKIKAAYVLIFGKRLDSEIPNGVSLHAFDGVTYEDSADLDLTMTYDVPVFAKLPLQPDGSEWTETDFNAMQFGYRSRGSF